MADLSLVEDGVDDLVTGLGRAAGEAADLTGTNRAAGDLVVLGARVPRVTGYLEDSLEVVADDDGVTVTAGARYAPFVHARDPFLTDSLAARHEAVIDLYTDHLADLVDTITGA